MQISRRTATFTESVLRGMTRLAMQYRAVNLAQGFPDFPAPEPIKRAAADAVLNDLNQYALRWGGEVLTNNLRKLMGEGQTLCPVGLCSE
jgi:aminotransferase